MELVVLQWRVHGGHHNDVRYPPEPIPCLNFPSRAGCSMGGRSTTRLFRVRSIPIHLTGPTTLTPLFSIAKRVHFMTNPPGLSVLVDRSPSQTPLLPSANGATCNPNPQYNQIPPVASSGIPGVVHRRFRFSAGQSHSIGANTPQTDQTGNYWVFEGFTNGIGQNGTYVPDNATNVAATVTASFVPGVKVTLATSQPGLQLTVDGRTNWQGYNFVWGQGETHTISAPATRWTPRAGPGPS